MTNVDTTTIGPTPTFPSEYTQTKILTHFSKLAANFSIGLNCAQEHADSLVMCVFVF